MLNLNNIFLMINLLIIIFLLANPTAIQKI